MHIESAQQVDHLLTCGRREAAIRLMSGSYHTSVSSLGAFSEKMNDYPE